MKLLIDIPENTYEQIKGLVLPDNATNGDVIKAMFGKEFADK